MGTFLNEVTRELNVLTIFVRDIIVLVILVMILRTALAPHALRDMSGRDG